MNFDFKTHEEGGNLEVALSGYLDAGSAPVFLDEMNKYIGKQINNVIFDFTDLEYISSAGLRIILMIKQKIGKNLTVTVKNPSESIMSVLEMSGFTSFLNIVKDEVQP